MADEFPTVQVSGIIPPDQDLRQLSFNMGGDKITCKAKKKKSAIRWPEVSRA